MKKLLLSTVVLLTVVNAADARPRTQRHHARHEGVSDSGRPAECYGIPWCGCWLRIQKGITDKAYNLAFHWRQYGHRVSGPVPGAVAIMKYSHVGIVEGVDANGNPIVKSGNHNGRVATAVYPKQRVAEYRM